MTVEISTDRARIDVELVHRFLSEESYWVKGISRVDVEACIRNSLCFGVFLDGRQVGFARVVSDFVRFAHLLDVFVVREFRGRGLSKLLMRHILDHPALARISKFTLGTADAHGLYRQFGFQTPTRPERQMERVLEGGDSDEPRPV
jgi:GNAT superfamily N-acetyltransferase